MSSLTFIVALTLTLNVYAAPVFDETHPNNNANTKAIQAPPAQTSQPSTSAPKETSDSLEQQLNSSETWANDIEQKDKNTRERQAQQDKYTRVRNISNRLHNIITRNLTYIQKWRDNPDCVVGEEAAKILDENISSLQQTKAELQSNSEELSNVNTAIAQYNVWKKEFLSKCK
jgi:hypothetical protein